MTSPYVDSHTCTGPAPGTRLPENVAFGCFEVALVVLLTLFIDLWLVSCCDSVGTCGLPGIFKKPPRKPQGFFYFPASPVLVVFFFLRGIVHIPLLSFM